MISITEEIAVPSPPQRVWQVIATPEEVVSCIGGAELGAAHEDGSFDGTLVVKFGAVRVRFAARITLELSEDTYEGRLEARGQDNQGATRFSGGATFRVTEGGTPDDARVSVAGEIKLNGRLASLVESGAGAVVSRMTKDFSAQLVQRCAPPGTAHGAADTDVTTAVLVPAPPRGLLGRLRAWWARLRGRPQAAHVPRSAAAQPSATPSPSGAQASGGANRGEQK